MELFLLFLLIRAVNKWMLKHDRQLYSKEEYDAIAAANTPPVQKSLRIDKLR